MKISLGSRIPKVADDAWVAPNASIVGAVTLESGASIWYGAVLRGDNEPITIGKDSNVQDNCVFHVERGQPVLLGEGVTIGHAAVVHGATIGDFVLVGMGAIIMNGAVIGDETLVAAGALVPEGMQVPPRSLVAGIPGKVRRELSEVEIESLHQSARTYIQHREDHMAGAVLDS
ncbi:gamma carbonic anhydrase family protein [Aeromicrobium sp. CF4.19]|uniref:gamma carbonic anhydrase family protein n=1 Tax=Aeromicrobium sp. CF4.19 TaxID=3373082 RepID=UPI003EE6D260